MLEHKATGRTLGTVETGWEAGRELGTEQAQDMSSGKLVGMVLMVTWSTQTSHREKYRGTLSLSMHKLAGSILNEIKSNKFCMQRGKIRDCCLRLS